MKLRLLATIALILALTGCEDPQEKKLRLGIECHQAGGEWVTAGKGGAWESTYQTCEFKHQKDSR